MNKRKNQKIERESSIFWRFGESKQNFKLLTQRKETVEK